MSLVSESTRDQSSEALSFADDNWNTTYEVPAESVWLLLKDLAEIGEWAVIEFHSSGIVGRVLDKSCVAMGRSVIGGDTIESAGAHCEVGVNVGAVDEFDLAFLASGQDVELDIDRESETLTLTEAPWEEEVSIQAVSQTRSEGWPDVEYGTTARMNGWEFCGAIEGASGATDRGFVLDADLNDIKVTSRDTPWETTIEDVVTETASDSSQFSSWFWPEICDRIKVEDDVEIRFGQDKPIEVQVKNRVEYVVAPQLPRDDESDGGDSE